MAKAETIRKDFSASELKFICFLCEQQVSVISRIREMSFRHARPAGFFQRTFLKKQFYKEDLIQKASDALISDTGLFAFLVLRLCRVQASLNLNDGRDGESSEEADQLQKVVGDLSKSIRDLRVDMENRVEVYSKSNYYISALFNIDEIYRLLITRLPASGEASKSA